MKTQNTKQNSIRLVGGWFIPAVAMVLVTAATVRADYQSTVLGDNPLAYYALNPGADGASVAPDLTGHGNDGLAIGIAAASGPSPYVTNAASFNGSAAIDLSQGSNPNLLNFAGPITLEVWAQPSSSSLFGDIVAKGYDSSTYQEIVLRVNGPYGANYYGSSGSVGVTGGTQTTNWTYVVLSSDGTTCSLYQNGVLVQQSPDTSGSVVFSDDWMIGNGSSSGNGRLFNGNISEVAIYGHGLTAAQVLTHYYVALLNSYPNDSAPIINTQPQPQTTYVGGTVTFSVQAVSALPMTNQWYKGGTALPGKTNATLSLFGVSAGDAVNYSVVVGNSNGTTNSAPAALTLLTPGNSLQWSANANNGVWDTGTSANWINLANSAQTVFNTTDQVLFDDTVGVPTTVGVNGTVSPSIMTVNSSANNFLFNGSGTISGPGSLVKEGSSTLTLNTGFGLTGPVTISGGTVVAGNYAFNSVASVTITNGATMDFGGSSLTDGKPITVSGAGVGGKGAIFNSGGAQYGQIMNITLAGDATFGGSSRWDLGGGAQISGAHNLTIDWSAGSGYGEWTGVTVGANVPGITLTSGNFGMKSMDNGFQNPGTVFTVNTNCELSFWNGGWNGSFHVRQNGRVDLWTAPAAFNGSNIIFEDGAMWYSWGNSSSDEPINSAITLNGVAHFVLGDHNLVYTNLISGTGGFVLDYWNHALVFSAANTYSGPTIIGTSGNSPEVALTGNGSISHSSLIFFGGSDPAVAHIDVSGRSDQTLTLANGQTLAGIGGINGSLVVSAGATLSPAGTNTTIGITAGANATGTLAAANNITLGGTTIIKLNGSGTNDVVQAGAGITYGGTLNLVNISGAPLAGGDTFQIFSAASLAGSFASITPATPGTGMTWDTTQLSSGRISVKSPPVIGSPKLSGTNLIFSGTGGTALGTYYVLTATNLTTPLANWIPVATNSYDASGNFNVTNALTPGVPVRFYRIKQ
jgi:hypothetical protein